MAGTHELAARPLPVQADAFAQAGQSRFGELVIGRQGGGDAVPPAEYQDMRSRYTVGNLK